MTRVKKAKPQKKVTRKSYPRFKQINGDHPIREVSEDCFVDYQVRTRHGGKVSAFNYDLAREIGLIPKNHPNEMSKGLEEEILDAFGVVIINEYDQINNIKFPKEDIRPNYYMATRYLQLQHPNKQGKTSGDGRSIWNGVIINEGKMWDISSCGTGATCLSPATHIKNKYFKTGDPTISYGCGYSEIDEGLSTMFFSEIMHRNNIKTERVLAIIDYGGNIGITVRVHDNLLRPSHFFNHLKQGNHKTLEALLDYYIDRQIGNGDWKDVPKTKKKRYEYFLDKQCEIFAKTAARFEDDYIFCWLDWDGDNILMDGGIIDYGSIRQFGLFHSEYRYDDVERFSTSLVEQKHKAKYTVQTFAQMVDYLLTGKKKPLKKYASGKISKDFENYFCYYKNRNLTYKMGFDYEEMNYLVKKHPKLIEDFRKVFHYFEASKSVHGIHKVSDGINWNAIFCMRDIMRELPQLYMARGKNITDEEFIEILKSNYALPEDLKINNYRSKKIGEFQKLYWKIVDTITKHTGSTRTKILLEMAMRSSIINKYDRVTGDSITTVTDRIMARRPKFNVDEMYVVLEEFTEYQNLDPDNKTQTDHSVVEKSKFLKSIFEIVRDYREGL